MSYQETSRLTSNTTTNKKESNCVCCISIECCRVYNKIGIFFFAVWFILQIVAISTPWETIRLSRTNQNTQSSDVELISMSFYATTVQFIHSITPSSGSSFIKTNTVVCSYGKSLSSSSTNILINLTSDVCPPLTNVGNAFPSITGTSAAAIISEFFMIILLFYRTTNSGINYMFKARCSTQLVSLFISALIVAFSSATFALYLSYIEIAIVQDFGVNLFNSYGCYASQYYLNCNYYTYYSNGYCLPGYYCDSSNDMGTGWIIAVSNMGMLTIGVVYTWIGSWCCPCCCPGTLPTDETTTITTTNPLNYMVSSSIQSNTPQIQSRTFTLFIHHGGPLPTKLSVTASTFQELEAGVAQGIGLTVPFRVAVYDDMSKQYVMVTNLELVPLQATVQLLFQ